MRTLRITNIIQSPTGVHWHRVCGLLAIAAAAALLSVKLLLAVYAAAGDLDPSFGSGGSITDNFFWTGGVHDLALQSDGKLLVVGPNGPGQYCTFSYSAETVNFKLVRFLSTGGVDTSFGTDGSAVLDLGGVDTANAVAVQPDGKILVAGDTFGCTGYVNVALVRYTVNGSLDTSFSTDGKVLLSSARVSAIVLQPDGKIVVVGQKRLAGDYRSLIARFNPNGSYDYSFGTYGEIYPDVWESVNDEGFRSVALQNDGKIVALSNQGWATPYRLLRYSGTGQLDSSFGFNGVFISAGNEVGYRFRQQADGRLVVAGSVQTNNVYYGALFRHNTDGSLDAAFGNGGKVYAVTPNTFWLAVAEQEDGKLVVGGRAPTASSNDEAALWRFQANGSPDAGFGVNGQVISAFA